MDDTINRQTILDALDEISREVDDGYGFDYEKWREYFCELPPALSTNLAEVGTDCISRQAAIDMLEMYPFVEYEEYAEAREVINRLPSAQPERTCVNCGRTVNNGGWYADGRTRCPIEEHYALPKDGYCHLWEKRNVADDDYPERRTDE